MVVVGKGASLTVQSLACWKCEHGCPAAGGVVVSQNSRGRSPYAKAGDHPPASSLQPRCTGKWGSLLSHELINNLAQKGRASDLKTAGGQCYHPVFQLIHKPSSEPLPAPIICPLLFYLQAPCPCPNSRLTSCPGLSTPGPLLRQSPHQPSLLPSTPTCQTLPL